MWYNEYMESVVIKIEKLDHYLRGISHINGKTFFVENALPDECVEACIDKEKKDFIEGHTINILKKAKERENPICPYYNECGGCNLMHIKYDNQLKFKENKVKEVLKKFCDYENIDNIIPTNNLYYRNKVSLQVNENIGYYKNKSYDLVPIDKCFIADKKINLIIKDLKKLDLKEINKIVIRVTSKQSMLIIYGKKVINLNINDFKDIDNIVCISDHVHILKGKEYIEEEINNIKYIISPTSFFQVNKEGMIKLYDKIFEYSKLSGKENLLDLYCGTGTIGIYLSKYCNKVLGIEINEEAISDAIRNKKINNLKNIEFKNGDVSKVLKQSKFKPDIIVVDPPRAGLDKKVINQIIFLKPKKLIYVSCDVVSLARDLNIFKEYFDIKKITPVDMFPNTYHVECVCVLNRR